MQIVTKITSPAFEGGLKKDDIKPYKDLLLPNISKIYLFIILNRVAMRDKHKLFRINMGIAQR